jgi:hypothetical protein
MRYGVLLCAVVMPLVASFSQRGAFGPTNGAISDRYPTLLVAAGYAFSIWGPIFLLDLLFALWQVRARAHDRVLQPVRPFAAAGFLFTASWMIVFTQQWFWPALAVMLLALGCMLRCALLLSQAPGAGWQRLPLSLHAGWLSMATFLNIAQVIVAYRLLPTDNMLPWSLVLLALAAALLLALNQRMRGNLGYAGAALWGLAGVYVKQSAAPLPGAPAMAWAALAVAAVLAVQTALLLRSQRTAPFGR